MAIFMREMISLIIGFCDLFCTALITERESLIIKVLFKLLPIARVIAFDIAYASAVNMSMILGSLMDRFNCIEGI